MGKNFYNFRMWIPSIFMYFQTAYVITVIRTEYRHYLRLRMEYLGDAGRPRVRFEHPLDESIDSNSASDESGKTIWMFEGGGGETHAVPQYHYSLMIEDIPLDLRSNKALYDYFDTLFPKKVHSASIVMVLPDLEKRSLRRKQVVRRIEKAIAFCESNKNGYRPSHIVGRGRCVCCGIEMRCCSNARSIFCGKEITENYESFYDGKNDDDNAPSNGDAVDSISYYTRLLHDQNSEMDKVQKERIQLADTGNSNLKATNWLDRVVNIAANAATIAANAATIAKGSLQNLGINATDAEDIPNPEQPLLMIEEKPESSSLTTMNKFEIEKDFSYPWSALEEKSIYERFFMRLGWDFVTDFFRDVHSQLDLDVGEVGDLGVIMSPTGFVTFKDMASVTCASNTPLTRKTGALVVQIAPDPGNIIWKNIHVDVHASNRKRMIAGFMFGLGAIFWAVPVGAIQVLATLEQLDDIKNEKLKNLIKSYLPVALLLGLILLLPVIFSAVATNYEKRKTFSEIQDIMIQRYFYYQIANIYITVTSGTVSGGLQDMIDHPSCVFYLLGENLPKVGGYFISLVVTKILAGLPMVLLRFGALLRMIFLRMCFRKKTLTQAEIDEVFKQQFFLYGWIYPSLLLVIMICFTYSCISPIILPVGAIYFIGALLVYKKQALFVFRPVHESGGLSFPPAITRTLVGLICGQLTFIGYLAVLDCLAQVYFLSPAPFITLYFMRLFHKEYVKPGYCLTLERAAEIDTLQRTHDAALQKTRDATLQQTHDAGKFEGIVHYFDPESYRQPILTEPLQKPQPYRRNHRNSKFDYDSYISTFEQAQADKKSMNGDVEIAVDPSSRHVI
eukprot:CAMPEP_0194382168 /NCGR_PEP_ID=MMETSP0174-20130528/58524_1 /TAXON_ID=216777 /ORGANISM="Proboscia alata, Strain PI-D3" /LENGTH=843 /DNA_ID=CAMNT_0039167247 /DNA_START=724 /DNA_END=3255 /DNA_ORIENTATION=+